ncbi:MAG: DUF1343 domain-containing protein [Victivallaceae bacterium]|nr:DUF1343 domain-containing protein [Victivallaceae bacterium]
MKMFRHIFADLKALFLGMLLCFTAGFSLRGAEPSEDQAFRSSVDEFLRRHTSVVKGKRVGLLTNPSGVDAMLNSTIDRFRNHPGIRLTALFAPEHGVRGDVAAGKHLPGGIDAGSGVRVFSLYGGKDHKPTKESLREIDVMVYHIQDVGCRTYTYIWHLAEAMKACGEAGIPVVVLDVPSAAGHLRADGPIREARFKSFIGLYPIPYTYALTTGELARYLRAEEKIKCELIVVPMKNYRRGMSFRDTKLAWVPTSPQIPSADSACCYAITGPIGTLGLVDIGINHVLPFQVVGAPWLDGKKMSETLNACKLEGVRFRPIYYTNASGAYKGQSLQGVQLHVTEPSKLMPFRTMLAILIYLRENHRDKLVFEKAGSAEGFDKAVGTDAVRKRILAGDSLWQIIKSYSGPVAEFERKSAKYRIYR